MKIRLDGDDEERWGEACRGIGTSTRTAAIRAFAVMYTKDASFRDDANAAAKRLEIDMDGRAPE